MIYSIDRIEEGIAVCFDQQGEEKRFPVVELYDDAKEGDCFEWDGVTATVLTKLTDDIREKNFLLLDALFGEE